MDYGWIRMHRKIQDNWVWRKKPFSEGQAWMDIVMMANYEDKPTLYEGELITVKRGSFITSILKLSNRFGWDRRKVKRFLTLLENSNMATYTSTTNGTTDVQRMHNGCTTALTTDGSKCPPTNNIINNKENNKNNIVEQSTTAYIKTIVEYLNERAGTNYKYQTATTQQHIKARLKEGFTVDDFKTVIDVIVGEWGNDTEMKKYLRPQTLFGTKFESYLNRKQQAEVKSGSSKYNDLPPELFG